MRIKMSRNDIRRFYSNIYCVAYCDMYHLLKYGARDIGYNSGVYGWNYTVYEIDRDTCILTGYRGFFGKRIPDKAWKTLEKNLVEYSSKSSTTWKDVEKRAKRSLSRIIEKMEKGGV